MSPSPITIYPDEVFPHLNKAPIVEAVIDLRARAETDWKESFISDVLKAQLPDYPKKFSLSGFHQEFTLGPGIPPAGKTIDTGWAGLRFQTEDGVQVAQFNRDGFLFARLRPYEQWERLIQEAMRLWGFFIEVAKPTEIQRIGLRFINRISLPPGESELEDFLEPCPPRARGLDVPFQGFFHQDIFNVPGHPYGIKFIRTIQPEQGPNPESFGLILDIDVFTTQAFEPAQELIERRLTDMRWLKNKMFFGNVTSKALEAFK